jgi:phosphoglycolate phosphatase-like HAD superfamily hydrolase
LVKPPGDAAGPAQGELDNLNMECIDDLNNTVECLHPGAHAARARVALFDFDGTISLIRSGWMDIMVPMMVEILLELRTGERETALRALIEDFVARLTGEQTIYQMMELARQVELRGGKPLEPLAYKRMYHEKLMANIEYRRQDLRHGAVSPEKYLVPGARAFLESLRERGLKLYCASGTDEVYTREEAALLEVQQFFEGRIFGAQDDYKSFSKEILIQRMISGLECKGEELLGFGDGYVEIKNVKDVGGTAVGLATAEPECEVVDQWKRQRLASVGVDFVIPNFLPREELLLQLFPNS